MTTRRMARGDRATGGGQPLRGAPALVLALAVLPPACRKKSDDDPVPPNPGLVLVESGGDTGVSEAGATDSFTVALRTAPKADVTVTLTPDAQVTAVPATLTFTPADWNVPQVVTVGAVDDGAAEGNHTGTVSLAAASADAAYQGRSAAVAADILDDDTSGTVSGTVRYTNRIYNSTSGLTGATDLRPVRQAEVEIVQSPGTVIGTGVTDDTGAYAIDVANVGTVDCFLRVYARRRDATSGVAGPVEAVVMNSDSARAVYTAASAAVSLNTSLPQTIDLDIPLAASSAFNILDTAVYTQQLLHALDATLVDPPLVTLYWQSGSSDGTYYDPGNDSIHLLGLSSDSDDFDDDVILHELGHYVLSRFSRDNSPGGSHTLTGRYDIRLTWSEGWAHFWSAAVRQWAGYPEYVWQVDTFGSSSHAAWRIDTPSYAASATGADNEVSIAALLWDIAAGAGDGGALGLGNDEIWDVIRTRFGDRYAPLTNERFATLEDFRDEWTEHHAANDLSALFAARTIRYAADADDVSPAANNDTGATAVALGALPATRTLRTFFKAVADPSGTNPVGDEDWYSFAVVSGTAYRVETSSLGDGADTYLHVYRDAAGSDLVGENDDVAAGDLSSRVNFTATTTGTYYIKVSPYPGDPPYPAPDQLPTYGSYTLSVSAP